MQNARWLLVLGALLMTPALAAALQPVSLVADTKAAGLSVRLGPTPEGLDGYVVVSHDDPIVGAVVDRVVPIQTSPGVGVEVDIGQVRSGLNTTVGLLERASLDVLLSNASSLLNGSLLADLPLLDTIDLGILPPSIVPLDLYAYPYADYGVNLRHPRVMMNAAGVMGVAYLQMPFDDGSAGRPVLRLSYDGGHRFEPALELAPDRITSPAQNSNQGAFASAVGMDGSFLFIAGHDDANRTLRDLTLSRVDPVTRVVERTSIGAPESARVPNYSPLVLPDASALVVPHSPVAGAPSDRTGPSVLRLDASGNLVQTTHLETAANTYMLSDEVWARAGPLGQVAVVWKIGAIDAPTLRVATSHDLGRSWTAARNVTGLVLGGGGQEISLSIDESGTLHLVATIHDGLASSRLGYAQVPRLGAPKVHVPPWEGEPIQLVSNAFVASSAGRTWILATVATASNVTSHGQGYAARMRTAAWEWFADPLGPRPAQEFLVKGSRFTFEGEPALMPDGRLVVTGSSSDGYAVVPLLDPFPEPACAAKDHQASGTPTPMTVSGQVASPQQCGDRFSFDVVPGGVRVQHLVAERVPSGPEILRFPSPSAEAATAAAVAVGLVAIAAAAMTEAARYGIGLLAARLFTRVQGKRVLQHAIRGGIHDHILQNPGIRFNRLRKELGLSHGATAYHLHVLQRHGMVRSRVQWTTRHYYPVASAMPATAQQAHDVILDFVRRNPGAGAAEIGRSLGLSRQLAHYHLRRLAAAGRLKPVPSKAAGTHF